MTTTNAAAVDSTSKGADKTQEKVAEKRRALGRGLESLLPGPRVVATAPASRHDGAPGSFQVSVPGSSETSSSPAAVASLQASAALSAPDGEHTFELQLEQIEENPYQTRRVFDAKALAELAASIEVQGVLQPIVVRPAVLADVSTSNPPAAAGAHPKVTEGTGTQQERFILILGERRFRASKMAGRTTIPAIVKRVSKQQAAEMTLVENLQRQDLNCIEQAEAFSNLSRNFNLTQEEIGKRAGISREQVSNYMRLLTLPESVIGALQTGKLTYSHARTLLQLKDHVEIWKFAKLAIEEKLSVAKLEDLVFGVSMSTGREPNRSGGARWLDPNVKAAQRALEEVLGMRVRISDRKGRGKILIEYATLEDFDRVVGMLKGSS